jgi:DNA-binding NarL/FixJ family response regulator
MARRKQRTRSHGGIKVSIVHGNGGECEQLVAILKTTRNFRCAGAFSDAETALAGIPKHTPDVVLVNTRLPGLSAIECVRRLIRQFPKLNVIMLAQDDHILFESFKAGANGYLLRQETSSKQIAAAIKEVMAGGSPITPKLLRKIVHHFRHSRHSNALEKLTAREAEVLDCLAQGWLYKEIAHRLGIGLHTARQHVKSIYRKLQVTSRTEAIVKYLGGKP